jgi:uncharacterized MAPEG superfamily protein
MEKFPAFGVYCFFTLGLVVLLFVLDGLGGFVRVRTKTAINPEDKTKDARVVEEEVADVQRANRVWRNAFANTIPFLIVAFLFVLTGAKKLDALIYFSVFAGARVLHALVYMLGKQPWRTIFFLVGQTATIGLAYHVVRYAISLP